MAKYITLKQFIAIKNNPEYDQNFRYLLEICYITALRINEVAKLIELGKNAKIDEQVHFRGKKHSKIDQAITPELKKLIDGITRNWTSGSSIIKAISRWNKKYGLEVESHSLRRLAATLIDKNLDTKHAQCLLDHKDEKTTAIYILDANKFDKKNTAQNLLLEISIHGEEIKTLPFLREENVLLKIENDKLKKIIQGNNLLTGGKE